MQKEYSPQEKAAVLAALLTGQSVHAVERRYNIPRSTIRRWRDAEGIAPAQGDPEKRAEIGLLVLAYLKANLETLTVQTEQFQDRKWLAKQGASDAAVLHGVLTDKAIRLLEAYYAGAGTDDAETE